MSETTENQTENDEAEEAKALDQIKGVHDSGVATINGRDYVFTKSTHKKRLKVLAYFTGVKGLISQQNFTFMGEERFEVIEDIINNMVTVDGSLLSKKPKHWDEHPQDYVMFIITAMGVISYPFLQGES